MGNVEPPRALLQKYHSERISTLSFRRNAEHEMPQKRTTLPALAGLTELDPSSMGEAMRALSTQRQRNFVVGKVFYGLSDHDACAAAGYSEAHASHHAHEVSRHPGVQAAIEEEARKLLKTEGPRSILCLVEIRDQKTNKPADRIKAATELMNRAGLHAVSEHRVAVHITKEAADREMLQLCRELGMSEDEARKLLVAPQDLEMNADGIYEVAPRELSIEPRAVAQRQTRARRKGMSAQEIAADKAQVQAARAEVLRRERAAHEAARADPWADEVY